MQYNKIEQWFESKWLQTVTMTYFQILWSHSVLKPKFKYFHRQH